MKTATALFLMLFCSLTHAKVEVLFHPHDPTLEKIGEWIQAAEHTVDIAMYNMDVTDGSPVIKALKSPAVKQRIESGDLKIRLIYEGYDTKAKNAERMTAIEDLGIDVRYLGKAAKVHHKFAVIDSARVISGSANWSMSSYRNYNENILFFENEQEANYRFHQEFSQLWSRAKEHGRQGEYEERTIAPVDRDDFSVHFNSPRILKENGREKIQLTEQIVRLIDEAQARVDVATTRIRLQPVLEAVHRAAKRGVQLRILLSQDDYHDLYLRAQWLFNVPGIQLRVKFYNLKVANYMFFQMHNKFLIVDAQTVGTGSFNWSESSENGHIENLIELRGSIAGEVMKTFEEEFAMLWDLGRTELADLQARLQEAKNAGISPKCAFKPMALEVPEIKKLLSLGSKCGG